MKNTTVKILFFAVVGAVCWVAASLVKGCVCTPGDHSQSAPDSVQTSRSESQYERVRALLATDSVSRFIPSTLDMPDGTGKLAVNHVGRYDEVFNDSNYVHWAEAAPMGIEPIEDLRGCWQMRRPMEKVTPCADFYVEPLTYSMPYLIPEAAATLHEIGRRFHDTIAARSGGNYRVKVTSLLRTPATVRRLRRVNSNSTDSSAHTLGTTFDISYARFVCDDPRIAHSADELKGVLAEVLLAMRNEGRCYVKFERKQPCFHISARPRKEQ